MIKDQYILKIKEIAKNHLKDSGRVFVFGSSVESDRFNDVDLAVISDNPEIEKAIRNIKNDLEESTLPYKFDVININQTNDSFRARVLNGPKLWII